MATPEAKLDFSAREVAPQGLLLQHLLRAHSIFLLHHAPSLADLFVRHTRPKFCATLERFWNRFIRDWDVLLHGTPATDIFSGIRLAAGGELGIGVGEEDWGSGEREVLEDFIHRTEGLIDVVVSRFGDFDNQDLRKDVTPWLGSGKLPSSSDGIIFSGAGAITRHSLASLSLWMEWMYQSGPSTYGVQDNPHTTRRRKRRKDDQTKKLDPGDPSLDAWPLGIPPPIVSAANNSLNAAVSKVASSQVQTERGTEKNSNTESSPGTEALMKYMTFGLYGSGWGLPSNKPKGPPAASSAGADNVDPKTHNKTNVMSNNMKNEDPPSLPVTRTVLKNDDPKGSFLIGLKGDLDDEDGTDSEEKTDSEDQNGPTISRALNSRIFLRTLYTERRRRLTRTEELELEEGKTFKNC